MTASSGALESATLTNDQQQQPPPQQQRPATGRSPVYRANPNVVAQRMGGDIVLVHLHTNQISELSGTSARAWDLLASGTALPTVIATLESEFDVEPARVRVELDAFLSDLLAQQLLLADDAR